MRFAKIFAGHYTSWLFPIIAVIWFGGAFVAIEWVGESKFTDFDPELRLSSELMSLSLEKELTDTLSNIAIGVQLKALEKDTKNEHADPYSSSLMPNGTVTRYSGNTSKGTIFHLYQGNCYCETLSGAHQQRLNKWAKKEGIAYKTLDLRNLPELRRFIPSTPAIIVLNDVKELVYLGPYSIGMGCFEDTGLVDAKIKPYFSGSNSSRYANIQSEAKGCYCATQAPLANI